MGEEADGQAAKADKETKRATARGARVQKTEGPTILTRVGSQPCDGPCQPAPKSHESN